MRRVTVVFLFVPILLCLLLSGCERVVVSCGDELVLNSWGAELDNGNVVDLSFSGDNATLRLDTISGGEVVISGFCELSENAFVIHDKDTDFSYAFKYIVHFDRVEIVYHSNTVSLYKKE